jgi:hypothetical protein
MDMAAFSHLVRHPLVSSTTTAPAVAMEDDNLPAASIAASFGLPSSAHAVPMSLYLALVPSAAGQKLLSEYSEAGSDVKSSARWPLSHMTVTEYLGAERPAVAGSDALIGMAKQLVSSTRSVVEAYVRGDQAQAEVPETLLSRERLASLRSAMKVLAKSASSTDVVLAVTGPPANVQAQDKSKNKSLAARRREAQTLLTDASVLTDALPADLLKLLPARSLAVVVAAIMSALQDTLATPPPLSKALATSYTHVLPVSARAVAQMLLVCADEHGEAVLTESEKTAAASDNHNHNNTSQAQTQTQSMSCPPCGALVHRVLVARLAADKPSLLALVRSNVASSEEKQQAVANCQPLLLSLALFLALEELHPDDAAAAHKTGLSEYLSTTAAELLETFGEFMAIPVPIVENDTETPATPLTPAETRAKRAASITPVRVTAAMREAVLKSLRAHVTRVSDERLKERVERLEAKYPVSECEGAEGEMTESHA